VRLPLSPLPRKRRQFCTAVAMKCSTGNCSAARLCPLPQCEECKGVYIILVTIGTLITLYFFILWMTVGAKRIVQHDVLDSRILNIPELHKCCSWWPVTHLVLFFVIGLFFPHCDLVAIGMGVLWELIESLASAGSIQDIFVNVIGFYAGKLVRTVWNRLKRAVPLSDEEENREEKTQETQKTAF